MKRKSFYLLLFFFTHLCFISAQQIVTDNSQQPNQLIQDLVGDNCATAFNISSSINGNINNIISYGSFDRGTSNFPLQSGIVLSTGSITSAGNTVIGEDLNEGEINWETDPDVLDVLGIDQTLNTTSIEFDFISANDFIAFKYIFASDEYQQDYPCNFRDVFAILIKAAGTTDPYVNIALVPGTDTDISTNTIHPNIEGFCPQQNQDYFQGYNVGGTNFNGQTTVLTANSSIISGQAYRIKFVIADHIDERFDSAVFIEAEGFGGSIDLGPDQSICGNDTVLNGDINNPTAIYTWFFNGGLIAGETNPTLQVNQSGTYNVEISIPVAGGNCTLTDTIEIEIIPFQNAAPIEDINICDEAPSDGIYDFNFSALKDAELLSQLPTTNYIISYHLSQDDAQNNTNTIVGIYQNTATNEVVFVRIESVDGSCLQLGSFNINVNAAPITTEVSVDVCEGFINDGGFEIIALSFFDFQVSDFEFNRTITYFPTENEAINNENSITETSEIIGDPEFVFARIVDDFNGCFSVGRIRLDYQSPPDIGVERFIYSTCTDPDFFESNNGIDEVNYQNIVASYDLTSIVGEIEDAYPGITFRILEFPLTPPPTIVTSSPARTIALGVSTGDFCEIVIPLELHKNLVFNVLQDERIVYGCDDASNDGILDFNLNDVIEELQSGYDIGIRFYENEADRDNDQNPLDLDTNITVTNAEQILYLRSTYNDCEHFSQVELSINPKPNFQPQVTERCGNFNTLTNTTQIAINPLSNIANQGAVGFNVKFYISEADANNQENEITSAFDVIGNSQMFYTRIINQNTGCFDISTILVNLSNSIDDQTIAPIIICNEDQDGDYTINLESVISEISQQISDFSYTFYRTYDNAVGDRDPILNPQSYTTATTELFIKIELNNQDCVFIISFDILIYNDPQLGPVDDFIQCEVNPLQPANFLFESRDAIIVNGQENIEVLYFTTENDALNNTNPIDKTIDYQNISNPQIIYFRIQNSDENSCFKVGDFQIEVREAAIFNPPTDIFTCDVNQNGMVTVDLNDIVTEITNGSPQNLEVSFHLTPLNANLGTNALPLNYTTSSSQQQVYARIENTNSGCYEVLPFYINALALPTVTEGQFLVTCADNFQLSQEWDLTATELLILEGRQFSISFNYFENELDLVTDTNEILNPEAYTNTSSPQTIFAKVTNNTTGCFTVAPFNLVLNTPPPINDFGTFNICENTTNSVDLLEVNQVLLDNTFNILVSYHISEADAENNINPLNTDYNYTNTTETLFARVVYSTTRCYAVYPFQLVVNLLPIANQPNNLVACDDDTDELLEFNLSAQDAAVLGGQNPDEFSVTYFNSQTNANDAINPLETDYLASNNEVVFVRIEDNITGCFDSTQFSVVVNPLPIIAIEDQVICLNNLLLVVSADTNNPTDSYLWSTNATSSEIAITEIGTYSVTITNAFGCQNTGTFNVTESESATIELTETIDFSDPNNITITISGIGNYLYILDDGEPQTSNVFENVALGYHTITIIDLNGCAQVTKEVVVVDAPKFFTPNNDNQNDTWHIVGIETLPGSIIYLFDRYGKLIKQLGSNTRGWDGRYNGNDMPSSDYWFLAEIRQGDISFEVKGHFTLRR
ncbi:T9SS type B sorting domain-containing protein [Winogradskyella sp. UBA3174]|uniref:T9SS type B sorting domain-containing protein n=1 Tax=Winogradskyella sp. UBA3174 TaxID=1947785 RepID=UPI0025FF9C1F|nr:T9SS type B sorting domain-containing protein [Winogradskyella sp. UBA3174]|tara:strand:+ start:49843 stop:54687 length:4845 start_codon:yes stop_codon:yes gene_type:complete